MTNTQLLVAVAFGLFAIGIAGAGAGAQTRPLAVEVQNQTRPTACAEEDNVSLVLRAPGLRRFRVEALPPAYLDQIAKDITAPDFSNCNFDGGDHPTDPRHRFEPRTVVLHEGARWKIVGMTLPSFWRPQRVPVTVDGRRDSGFHMIQVYDRTGPRPREAIVMYPSDGYWRLKPLPTERFGDGVYGSSFVMGPIDEEGRPIARIASIRIRSQPLSFDLRFEDGTGAQIKVAEVSERKTALDVRLAPGPSQRSQRSQQSKGQRGDNRFAVLRSMYVAQDNADMSEVRWLPAKPDGAPSRNESIARPLPEVDRIEAREVRFGRSVPSRHNTSAPDIRFADFEGRAAR
ncbi:conserved hypothetical protein [Burkholderiales bacterium 8X]|nr:conserved hypothetical protein [Burkholderiales bacterium 8X]